MNRFLNASSGAKTCVILMSVNSDNVMHNFFDDVNFCDYARMHICLD